MRRSPLPSVVLVTLTIAALGGCDSPRATDVDAVAPTSVSLSRGNSTGQSFWNGTVGGGGSWRFAVHEPRTTALTIHQQGRRLLSRVCPADILCGGIFGGSGDAFINIMIMEEYVSNEPMRFAFTVAWGDSQRFEAAILYDLNAWWDFMSSQAGVSTPIVIQNIQQFIASSDNVITGTTRATLLP